MAGFNKRYFLLAVGLFWLEVFIARFVHDQLIRPYAGDLLATILLYCLAKSFVAAPTRAVVAGVLLFSYLVEAAQYGHLVAHLGLQHVRLARIVLGTQFEWADMLAYTLGAGLVLAVERQRARAARR